MTSRAATTHRNVNRYQQRGITLLESLLVLTLCITVMALLAVTLQQHSARAINQETATQLKKVCTAAKHYVCDHWEPLTSAASAPIKIDVEADLIGKSYLSLAGIPKNPYQQTYQVRLLETEPQKNKWQLCVTTHGGQTISPHAWRQIGPHTDALTSYVVDTSKQLITWRRRQPLVVPKAVEQALTTGHLTSCHSLEPAEIASLNNFLHRTTIPTRPALNQMNTDLQLQQHTISLKDGPVKTEIGLQRWRFKDEQAELRIDNAQKTSTNHYRQPKIILKSGANDDCCVVLPTEVTLRAHTPTNSAKLPMMQTTPPPQEVAPQLHGYWNKIPPIILPTKTSLITPTSEEVRKFAHQQCRDTTAGSTTELSNRIGRLFVIVPEGTQQGTSFICGKIKKNARFAGHAYPLLLEAPAAVQPTLLTFKTRCSSRIELPSAYTPLIGDDIIGIDFPDIKSQADYSEIFKFIKQVTKKIMFYTIITDQAINLRKDFTEKKLQSNNYNTQPAEITFNYLLENHRGIFETTYLTKVISGLSIKKKFTKKLNLGEEIKDYLKYMKDTRFDPYIDGGRVTNHKNTLESIYKSFFETLHYDEAHHYAEYRSICTNRNCKTSETICVNELLSDFYTKLSCFNKFEDYCLSNIIRDLVITTAKKDFPKIKFIQGSLEIVKFPEKINNAREAEYLCEFLIDSIPKGDSLDKLNSEINSEIDGEFSFKKFVNYYNKKITDEGSELYSTLKEFEKLKIKIPGKALYEIQQKTAHPVKLKFSQIPPIEVDKILQAPRDDTLAQDTQEEQ